MSTTQITNHPTLADRMAALRKWEAAAKSDPTPREREEARRIAANLRRLLGI